MELIKDNTFKIIAILLALTVATQAIYTVLFISAPGLNPNFIWGLEGIFFALLAVFAGYALVTSKRYALGFAAITVSAIINLVQVSVGFALFEPFQQAAETNPDLAPVAFGIVSLAFFIYNAAKIALSLAVVIFGMAKIQDGGIVMGRIAVGLGAFAILANALMMNFGLDGFLPSPVAGGTGVLATILLAIFIFDLNKED